MFYRVFIVLTPLLFTLLTGCKQEDTATNTEPNTAATTQTADADAQPSIEALSLNDPQVPQGWQRVTLDCGDGSFKRYWTFEGAESGPYRDDQVNTWVSAIGRKVITVDYAAPAASVTGRLIRRYADIYYNPEFVNNFKGIVYDIHGGGGFRGSARNLGRPSNGGSTSSKILFAINEGWIVVSPEYRRGYADRAECEDCPFFLTAAEYALQDETVEQATADIQTALEFVEDYLTTNLGESDLPVYITGTSFGGVLAGYVTLLADPTWTAARNIEAAWFGFGGWALNTLEEAKAAASFNSTVDYYIVLGMDDELVPAIEGPTYHNILSPNIIAGGFGLYRNYLQPAGIPAKLVASCGLFTEQITFPAIHGVGWWGSNFQEQKSASLLAFQDFLNWIEAPTFGEEWRCLTYTGTLITGWTSCSECEPVIDISCPELVTLD